LLSTGLASVQRLLITSLFTGRSKCDVRSLITLIRMAVTHQMIRLGKVFAVTTIF